MLRASRPHASCLGISFSWVALEVRGGGNSGAGWEGKAGVRVSLGSWVGGKGS